MFKRINWSSPPKSSRIVWCSKDFSFHPERLEEIYRPGCKIGWDMCHVAVINIGISNLIYTYTAWNQQQTPLKIGHPKTIVFQPSIFRCENVSFREGMFTIYQLNYPHLSTLRTTRNLKKTAAASLAFSCACARVTEKSRGFLGANLYYHWQLENNGKVLGIYLNIASIILSGSVSEILSTC